MKVVQALHIAVVAIIVGLKNGTANVPVIDTSGSSQLDVLVGIGDTDVPLTALKLQESDDKNGPFVDMAVRKQGPLPGAGDSGKVFVIHADLLAHKRYIKVIATAPAGTLGANLSVTGVLSENRETKSDPASRGLAGETFV